MAFQALLQAQSVFYKALPFGNHKVGFTDSIIFNPQLKYEQYGYEGDAPLFVKIWFPTDSVDSERFLSLNDYRTAEVPSTLQRTYEALNIKSQEVFVQDLLMHNIQTDEKLDYGIVNCKQIFAELMQLQGRSILLDYKLKTNYPVIVYHHGSQAWSTENSIMAEYFASHGFIFVSANFHLPYEKTTYGLIPFDQFDNRDLNQSNAKQLILFSKSLTQNQNLFFIGHSWGAQQAWCFLHEPKWAKAFVSLETTVEYKSNPAQIEEMWPQLYNSISIQKHKLHLPILSFAAEDEGLNFNFFESATAEHRIFAAYKTAFAHNSYTSDFLMRIALNDRFPQSDSTILKEQLIGYAKHIRMIHRFFESVLQEKKFVSEDFIHDFNFY